MGSHSSDSRVQAGATFLIPSGPSGDHLFVVALSGNLINGKEHILLASFCTIRNPLHDQTCIVKAGEHPFVVSDSYINYAKCRSEPVEDVIARLNDGVFKVKNDNVTPELLKRIRNGLTIAGGRTPRYIKKDWNLDQG